MKVVKSTSKEKKFFNILFRALFKNSWCSLHENLRFDNIYLRELLDILHKEMDEITVLKSKDIAVGKESGLHNFLGTNRFSFWSGVRTALSHLLIGLDEKQGTIGKYSNRQDVLHVLNVFKTEVKTGQAKINEASVKYVAKVVERILDNQDRLDAVRLIRLLNITKKGGQGALTTRPISEIHSLMVAWAEDIIDCQPGDKTNVSRLTEQEQIKDNEIGEEETHVNTYRDWWKRYRWFALNTYLFKKTLFGERMTGVYDHKEKLTLAPSVIAAGSLNETQLNNIKKEWKIDINPNLELFYVGADWWKEYPDLDKDFMTELALLGSSRVTP